MAVRRSARIVMAVIAALGLTAGVGGCGAGSGTKDAKTTTLTVVATNYGDSVHKNSQGYWDRVGLAFQAAHPGVRVVTTVYPADTVDAKVAALVKRGKAPDVVQTGSFAEYAAAGQLYSAEELLSIPSRPGSYGASPRRARWRAPSTGCRSPRAPGCSTTTRSCSGRPASNRRRPGRNSWSTRGC